MSTKNNKEWFQSSRFGLFLHWGIYALPARGEWIMSQEEIDRENYKKYFDYFDPDLFKPAQWAAMAKAAGMKYVVFTTKHHDGFCMWDTKYTDFNSAQAPQCRKDLTREVVDAFTKEGLKIGLYYSLPDWFHSEYPIDCRHPLRNASKEVSKKRNTAIYTEFLYNQVEELLTNYGQIDIIWFDGSYPELEEIWNSSELSQMIRKKQKDIIIVRLPGHEDLATPEQHIPDNGMRDENGKLVAWEGCQVFTEGRWGYSHNNTGWKQPREVIEMLIKHTSRGGNLLLNIGPTARGSFDKYSQNILSKLSEWMELHNKAIYDCTVAPEDLIEPEGCRYTYNPTTNKLYLHFLSWPDRRIFLPNTANKISYAQFLHDGSEIQMKEYDPINFHNAQIPPGATLLSLPVVRPDVAVPVIELFLG